MLFEEMMEDPLFPSTVDVTNIDISETAIEWVNEMLSKSNKKKSGNIRFHKSDNFRRFCHQIHHDGCSKYDI